MRKIQFLLILEHIVFAVALLWTMYSMVMKLDYLDLAMIRVEKAVINDLTLDPMYDNRMEPPEQNYSPWASPSPGWNV